MSLHYTLREAKIVIEGAADVTSNAILPNASAPLSRSLPKGFCACAWGWLLRNSR
jgi:hypothetical protein